MSNQYQDDDFQPLLGSLGDVQQQRIVGNRRSKKLRYPSSSQSSRTRAAARMRPMNVASQDFSSVKKETCSRSNYTADGSESSEDVPLLLQQPGPSLMESSTFLGVEDRAYSRNQRRRRRQRRTINAWDQGVSGHISLNSSPITHVGCCHSGCCCCPCVRTGEVGVLQLFGRFERVLSPGLVCILWPCYRVGRVSLRMKQVDLQIETKTKDAVFVTLRLSVQYRVSRSDVFQAYYSLTDQAKQISTVVYDVVRSKVPQLDIDELFSSKTILADEVGTKLDFMRRYGFVIVHTLVTSISPVTQVRESMNEINASKRIKDGAPHRAEGEKIARVKSAEAAAEKAYLDGVGVARARTAIASSMKESLLKLDVKESLRPKHIMDLLLVSHYFDTLAAVGAESIVVKHTPDEIAVLKSEIADYFERSPIVVDTAIHEDPDLLANVLSI